MIIALGKAAKHIIDDLLRNNFELLFSKLFTSLLKLIKTLHYALYNKIIARFKARKPSC